MAVAPPRIVTVEDLLAGMKAHFPSAKRMPSRHQLNLLARDLNLILLGIRDAALVEGMRLPEISCVLLGLEKTCKYGDLPRALQLEGNEPVFLVSLDRLRSDLPLPELLNISDFLVVPRIMGDEERAALRVNLLRALDESAEKYTPSIQLSVSTILSCALGHCGVAGWLLGYPVVYCCTTPRNCLSGQALYLHDVYVATVGGEKSHSCPAFSFSTPVDVDPDLKSRIDSALSIFQQKLNHRLARQSLTFSPENSYIDVSLKTLPIVAL
eukprot:201729_1